MTPVSGRPRTAPGKPRPAGGADRATKARDLQRVLADDIVHGRLKPGTTLDETTFAKRFGVSRTPMREAIRQLEMTGLVETRPHRGAVVADIAEEALDDMFAVMAELEGLCARWSAVAMGAAERRSLKELHARAADFVRDGDRDAYVAANDGFHDAIYNGAHSPFLSALTRSVRLRLAPFRRAQFEGAGRLARSHAEHGRIVEAIDKGDGEAACRDMRAHIIVVRDALEGVARRGAEPAPRSRAAPKL